MVALVTILTPVVMVIIFSFRVLGIYYVHSKKLSKLKSEKSLKNAPDLATSGYRLVLFFGMEMLSVFYSKNKKIQDS